MFDQIARKVEEYMTGTPAVEISGSTTVRIAVGLIVNKCLTNTEFDDDEAWARLDRAQRQAVAHHRPKSKFARWLEEELRQEKELHATRPPIVLQLMKRIDQAKAGGKDE